MQYLRTPDNAFENLPDFTYEPHYINIDDGEGGQLRVAYIHENPSNNTENVTPVLLMHGEPSWSFLYRKMIPGLLAAGHSVIAPDLVGFGRSDKPSKRTDYTYRNHVDWMTRWLNKIDLNNIVLFCQDWGGLIGLRLVAGQPDRFAGVIAANTFLPTGDVNPGDAFMKWKAFSQNVSEFPSGSIIQGATVSELSDDVVAAYNAPYPDETYKEGARQFPVLVPISPDNPESIANRKAWQVLSQFKKPFLTAFSDQDPITAGGDKGFQKNVPGTEGQNHVTINGGGHFLQEDKGEQLAEVVAEFITSNKL